MNADEAMRDQYLVRRNIQFLAAVNDPLQNTSPLFRALKITSPYAVGAL